MKQQHHLCHLASSPTSNQRQLFQTTFPQHHTAPISLDDIQAIRICGNFGKYLALQTQYQFVHIFDMELQQIIYQAPKHYSFVCIINENTCILQYFNRLHVVHLQSGAEMESFFVPLQAHSNESVQGMFCSTNEQYLAVLFSEVYDDFDQCRIVLYNYETKEKLYEQMQLMDLDTACIIDNEYLFFAGSKGHPYIYNMHSSAMTRLPLVCDKWKPCGSGIVGKQSNLLYYYENWQLQWKITIPYGYSAMLFFSLGNDTILMGTFDAHDWQLINVQLHGRVLYQNDHFQFPKSLQIHQIVPCSFVKRGTLFACKFEHFFDLQVV